MVLCSAYPAGLFSSVAISLLSALLDWSLLTTSFYLVGVYDSRHSGNISGNHPILAVYGVFGSFFTARMFFWFSRWESDYMMVVFSLVMGM